MQLLLGKLQFKVKEVAHIRSRQDGDEYELKQ